MFNGYYQGSYQFQGREPYRYGLTLITPGTEPVTTAEFKTHARVDISTDDTYIGTLIQAARDWVENHIGRRIATQTWDLTIDYFHRMNGEMRLPFGPYQSITSIKYIDLNGTTQTVDSSIYGLDATQLEPRLYLQFTKFWPVERYVQNAVTIRHVAGYATVPEKLKLAIKLLACHWYEVRSDSDAMKLAEIPMGVRALLAQEKQGWL